MSSSKVYDVCVVGAGVMGSATARQLAQNGQEVLLLEQFPLPHSRGSSHGQSRIFRTLYSNPVFVRMARDSLAIWKDIELHANEEIYIRNVGLLSVEEAPGLTLKKDAQNLKDLGIGHEVLSPSELRKRFPSLQFDPGYSAVLERSAGVMRADKCLRALQEQFIRFGGSLKDGQKVLSIQPDGTGVTIKTSIENHRARKLILTVGPWTNNLLKPLGLLLPIRVYRAPVLYWSITKPDEYSWKNGFPSFYDASPTGKHIYCLSYLEYPDMLKVRVHHGNAERRDMDRQDIDQFIKSAGAYVKKHFPYLDHKGPAIVEMCLYSMTPDSSFILDKHPTFDNIIIGAGFSAHGFKHAPVVGQILSDLARDQTPAYDITPFRISRFKETHTDTKSNL
ncbi:predicted protein [Nematostella vectensis]|uniref:FAD dependent oxidoreductase domain-containing protein n=1 Tax=Nematostella vectensis TaxID=45351 RepID=A7RRI9_NEMVE|nr:predicted protein [Nematostella vectensis]|eukprot:XP_001638023.1 predicted protein [Nematostella vectensis]